MSNILNLSIVFLMFILTTLFWHQIFRKTPEESMAFTSIFVMVGGFCAGLFGDVRYIYILLILCSVCGIGAFVFDLSFVGKDYQKIWNRLVDFFSPCVFMICLIFIYAVIAFRGALFTAPDEINQWGVAVKYMNNTHLLPFGETFTGDSVIFSIASLFQYIWGGLVPFIEKNCMIGNFLLAFIPSYLPFSGKGWREWKKIVVYTMIVFLSFNVVSSVNYNNLLQDYILPMWTGGVIAWLLWSRLDSIKKSDWVFLFGSLACVASMKSMVGPLFAGVILITIVVRQWSYFSNSGMKRISYFNAGICTFFSVISILSINGIWSKLIEKNIYNRFLPYDAEAKSIIKIGEGILNKAFEVTAGTMKTFPNLSYFIMLILVAVFVAFIRNRIIIEKKKMFLIIFSLYIIGFIAYLMIMLYAYMFVFGAEDSALVAGLERYLAYYMLLGCVPIYSLVFTEKNLLPSRTYKCVRLIILIGLLFSTGDSFISKATSINQEDNSVYVTRQKMQEEIAIVKEYVGEEKIYLFGVLSSTEGKIITYELGQQLDWEEDCYKLYNRTISDVNLCKDIISYPELLNAYNYKYVWVRNLDSSEQINRINYLYHLSEFSTGDLYEILDNGEWKYLCNVQESLEDE